MFWTSLVCLHEPVIQANGRLTFEARKSAMLHSEPAFALGLPTVWSLWGNLGMARCQEMSILPAGYNPQRKASSASSSGALGFTRFHCVWSVVGWLIVCQDGFPPRWRLSPTNWPIQSDHLLIADYDDTAFEAGTLTCTFLMFGTALIQWNLYLSRVFGCKTRKNQHCALFAQAKQQGGGTHYYCTGSSEGNSTRFL